MLLLLQGYVPQAGGSDPMGIWTPLYAIDWRRLDEEEFMMLLLVLNL
jgi:hypothetical protein